MNALAAILLSLLSAPRGAEILDSLERQNTMRSDIQSRVVMTQQKPKQGARQFEMQYFRRDRDDAFVILVKAPESERGNGYLRAGEHFWMYRRNTRTFQHVNRDESIAGSDAKGDDFENRKLTELYEAAKAKDGAELLTEEKLGAVPTWKLEVRAKARDVDYPRKIYWVKKDGWQLLKEEAYSASGTLMQTAYYLKYQTVDGRLIPARMMFNDEFEKGNRTMVELSDIRTAKIPDEIFTKAWVESQSR